MLYFLLAKNIQQQLGHSSVNVTAERYKNIIPDVKIGVMNLI